MHRKALRKTSDSGTAKHSTRFRFAPMEGSTRAALLAGTAMLTTVVMTSVSSPALANCSITNAPGQTNYDYWDVLCQGDIQGKDSKYSAGDAPVSAGDKTFNDDIVLTAPAEINNIAIYNYVHNGEGIIVDATTKGKVDKGAGYDVTLSISGTTAIQSTKNGIVVSTNTDAKDATKEGTIIITSGAFIEATGGDGINAKSENGDITITNTGIIGVDLINDLKVVNNQLVNGSSVVQGLVVGEAFSKSTVSGNGITAETKGGTVNISNGTYDSSDFAVLDAGAIYSTKDGISVKSENNGTYIGDAISIVNAGDIYASKSGIKIELKDKGTGSVYVANAGHIESTEAGINIKNAGTGSTTILNLAENTIISAAEGIKVEGKGGSIFIGNGTDGYTDGPPNLDGVIKAGTVGISATNDKGGSITVVSSEGSSVSAAGEYGIFAQTKGTFDCEGDDCNGSIDIHNAGFLEATGVNAKAAIYGETGKGDGGFVLVSNGYEYGSELLSDPVFNVNARVNAYKDNGDGTYAAGNKTAGVQIKSDSETGGYLADDGNTYGAIVYNDGIWDFTGDDSYLTPGFDGLNNTVTDAADTIGGIFAPDGSAIDVKYKGDADTGVFNYGTIIGLGDKDSPVMKIDTKESGSNTVRIYNDYDGLIGSSNTPVDWTYGPLYALSPGIGGDAADWGYIDYTVYDGWLTAFADASDDMLLKSKGAPLDLYNDGILIGQLDVDSKSGSNLFTNYGAWFVTGESKMKGEDGSELENFGLVQAAFDWDFVETTKFKDFDITNSGLLSMIDGGSGDEIVLEGNYEGDYDAYEMGSSVYREGLLGVDVDFYEYSADVFYIVDKGKGDKLGDQHTITGSTGIIVNTVEAGGLNSYGIDVVDYSGATGDAGNGTPVANTCDGPGSLCKEGDAFFISDQSRNYVNIGGYGAVQNGFFASFLRQDEDWEDFELITTWGADAYAFPSLVTGAQNIWYETGGVVQDHIYGNHFPLAGAGGGGADMAEPMPVVEPVGGPALWGKVGGSWTTRDTSVTEDIGGSAVTFDSSYDQDIYSILAGVDFTHSNAWRFGIFGGYVSSSMDFDNYALSGDYSGGTVGAYAAYTAGAFYADAEVKADFLSLDYTSAALGEPSADVTNVGVLANTGYRFDMGRMYFEPIASFAYLNTSVDGGNYGGAEVDFDNGTSLRGGLGARVGGTFATGAGSTELAVLGKVWNEFEDANTVTLTDNATLDSQTFEDSIDGVFGEVTGTATYYNADRSFSGFLSGGVKFNSDFTTVSAQAGLRKKF